MIFELFVALIIMLVFTRYIWEAVCMIYQEHKNLMNEKPRRTLLLDFMFISEENKNAEYMWWLEFSCYSILGLVCTYQVVVMIYNLIKEIFILIFSL